MTRPDIIRHTKACGYTVRPCDIDFFYPLINGVGRWAKNGISFTIQGTLILAKKKRFSRTHRDKGAPRMAKELPY